MCNKSALKNRFFISAIVFVFLFNFSSIFAKETIISEEVMQKIEKVVDAPSCFAGVDGLVRKGRKDRIKDMIEWYEKNGTVGKRYNDYGLDIKSFRNQDDFLSVKTYDGERRHLHHGDIRPREYKYLARDKLEFYKEMKKGKLANKTPKINYSVQYGKVIYPESKSNLGTPKAIKSLGDGKYICKPQYGRWGQGIYVIEKKKGVISFFDKNSNKVKANRFFEKIYNVPYVIQKYVVQHKKLSKLNPSSLNTMRIVTTRYNEDVHILGAFLKMGCNKAVIDNAHAGGTFVGINSKNGKLRKYGCHYSTFNKKAELCHPVSHVKYEGYKLPYWEEVMKLVKDAHKVFSGLSSAGWDVAITEKGPVIIELNMEYSLKGFQTANGGIKEKWHKLKEM